MKTQNNFDVGGKVSASEFVLSTYNPHVALFCTPAASSIAAKNNLTVAQLLAPFTKVQVDVSWHEPLNGQLILPKGLRITPVDVATTKRVDPDSQNSKKRLQNVVSSINPSLVETETSKFRLKDVKKGMGSLMPYNVEAPFTSPWFSCWREQFIRLHSETKSSLYDYLHHFMACVLVMSSTDGLTTEALTETVGKLSKLQQQHQTTWANTWTFNSVLKFYLIIHEKPQVEQQRADAMYQSLRTTYGGNFCFMVQLAGVSSDNENNPMDNSELWAKYIEIDKEEAVEVETESSASTDQDEDIVSSDLIHPLSPDSEKLLPTPLITSSQNGNNANNIKLSPSVTFGQHLSAEDIKSLQVAVNEFVSKALLPYIDRQSRLLNEAIVNRRSMSKSFFSATKRLFGGSAKTPSSIVYTNESLEMMSRKLADVYFLFGHYAGSYQLYHQLKKDFLGDSAWIYYASSLEMAAVSHFMMSQVEPPLAMTRAFPVHYVTDAINYYIDSCRMSDSAMKCALICCECLKQMDNYSEAAAIYIRMTSEDCDLKSALMLEQAAYSFLHVNYIRKYALHCVLAGHRYSKAGLKTHSLKCYIQAHQIYSNRAWRFAEDHVNFTIARHQTALQLTTDIFKYLQPRLVKPTPQPIISQSQPLINSAPVKVPIINCVKLEYSTMKLLNATSFVGIIQAHNLTPDSHLTIESMEFRNKSFHIKKIKPLLLTTDEKNDNADDDAPFNQTSLVPMESRNIIFIISNSQLGMSDNSNPQIFIDVRWKLRKPDESEIFGTNAVQIEDLLAMLSLDENSFIFQVNHTSKCSNDFNQNPCFFSEIEILLHARIGGKFIIKLEKSLPQANIGPSVKSCGDEIAFVGQTSWLLEMVPFQTYKLNCRAAIMQPGIFNVAPTITVTNTHNPTNIMSEPRKYVLHSPLIVTHSQNK